MRIGILGSGFMGSVHAAAWSRTPAEIAGFFSVARAQAAGLAAKYNVRAYDSYEELLADCDVVDICTPTYLHREQVERAAAAGKHILCEKPLALTAADGRHMIAACQSAGVKLLVAHVVRFFPEYALAQQTVQRGEIGQVAVIRLSRCSFQPRLTGDRNWFLDPAKSGGMIMDLMIHDFDYARWIGGEVVSVFTKSVRGANPAAPTDYALAILRHASGAISHIEGGWAYPPPLFRTSLEIAGSRGLIEHPFGSSTPLEVVLTEKVGNDAEIAVPTSPLIEDPYLTEIRHFYDVLAGHLSAPRVTGEDALAAVQIALAAIRSAQTGQPVSPAEVS